MHGEVEPPRRPVVAEGAGDPARERELRLATAKPAAIATGTVRIAISPWGNVEVDGAASGVAPPLTELTLAEGRHQIVVRNGDFAPFVATVNGGCGQHATISMTKPVTSAATSRSRTIASSQLVARS